ncbi:MAG: hypothetical protein OXG08_08415 [Gammaproteobacteria bacterium]|nr:hypothetical protein [Gammaproteobacteria bacterium]
MASGRVIAAVAILYAVGMAVADADDNDLNEVENVREYGACKVFDRVDAFTDKRVVNLRCKTEKALLHMSIPPVGFPTMTLAITDKVVSSADGKVQVDYRIGDHEGQSRTVAYKTTDKTSQVSIQELLAEDWLEELRDSDRVIFRYDGASGKIDLTNSAQLASDLQSRVRVSKAEAKARSS